MIKEKVRHTKVLIISILVLLLGKNLISFDSIPIYASSTQIQYQTHIQDYGWQDWKSEGGMSGTQGECKRLEGIRIKLSNQPYSGGIEYRTHVQDYGWQNFVGNGQMSGTSGECKRLEAIQIRLTGEMAEHYDIYYRVHAEEFGWLAWTRNGKSAGTEGFSYRLEGIEIRLIDKNNPAPGNTRGAYKVPMIQYTTHVQDYGWQAASVDGQTSGTEGESKRLEGVKIKLVNQPYTGDIEYATHVQDYGWQNFVGNDSLAGTFGECKRLEAIKIRLKGSMAQYYDVYYRVHVENLGWQDWVKNGEAAGTEGLSYRLEGLEIKLVDKGNDLWIKELDAAKSSSQLVVASVYDGTYASVTMYSKNGDRWKEDFTTIGRTGSKGIQKEKEGDKKSPSGIYGLHTPFGIRTNPGCPMAYLQVTENHYWGGSPDKYYNTMVDISESPDYIAGTGEHIIDYGSVYNYCVAIDYNPEGVVGKGSAIFLHCQGKGTTAGCISIPESNMVYLLQHLRSDAKIIIDYETNIGLY